MKGPLLLGIWVAGAVFATGVGFGAVNALGEGLALREGQSGLVSGAGDDLSATASEVPAVRAVPSRTAVPSVVQQFRVRGNSGAVRCVGTTATLLTPAPAPGWRIDHWSSGPGRAIQIEFRRIGTGDRLELAASCVNGRPSFRSEFRAVPRAEEDRATPGPTADNHGTVTGPGRGGADDPAGDDKGGVRPSTTASHEPTAQPSEAGDDSGGSKGGSGGSGGTGSKHD